MATINIPQIRFKGFEGEWEKKIFEDICTFGNGYTPSKAIDEYWENGTLPWYRMEDIRENGRILKDSIQHITPKAVKGKLFPANSIIMSTTATIGEHALLIADSLANQRFTFFIKNVNRYNYDDLFFFYKCYSIGEWCKKNANAGGLLAVNMPELKKLGLSFPTSISEQTRIASLFTAIDKQISTSEAKLDKLRTIKKTLLKKMFAAQGELTPQIRFKGFDGAWEEKKLVDFVHFFNGQTYTPNDVKSSGTLVLRSSNVQNDKISLDDNVFIDSSCANVNNVKKGDIIVVVRNGSRSLIGKHAVIEKEMPDTVIGAFMTGIRSDIPYFTNALLSSPMFEKKVSENLGATINQITGYMFERMNFNIPSLPKEQACIASLFNSLDKQINLQEQKIEKLKAIKKTLLKKMFV